MNFVHIPIFLLCYAVGILGVVRWRKRKDDPDIFFFCSCWTLGLLISYTAIIELMSGSFYLVIPLLFLGVFLFSYFKNKTRLLNGFLFNCFILVFGGYLLFIFYQTRDLLLSILLFSLLLVSILVLGFGFYAGIIFLYWNAVIVLRKESHSLANLLTLLLAIFLTVLLVINHFTNFFPDWLSVLFSILPLIMVYFFISFLNFLTVSLLYQFNHPRYNQDFIIVLGAGLLGGEKVSPLLARRIDKAIEFYNLQIKSKQKSPKLLMSGGQGTDEKIPEALAMKEYALAHGIPEEDILVEINSTTTYENMKFSKEIMDSLKISDYNVIFTSNNYHIFRAGIYADWAKLKADGLGAKTAFYYLPNAFLREFIAIIAMRKKRHLTVAVLMAIFIAILAIITQIVAAL